ncbi:MAG TPA: trypsin-like peptidase domain-containing protein [Rhodocyclaceae bacterium]
MKASLRIVCVALLAFVLASVIGHTRQAQPRPVTPRGELTADEKSTIDIFRRASNAVVYITTLDQVLNPWTLNVREVPSGTGSGFIWDDQVHVVTNYHVIANASAARVRLSDQRTYDAKLVGVSPENDLAVLRLQMTDQKPAPLPLGSSRDLLVGQKVLAIGNPFGLDHTLTTGIVSALDRSIGGDGGHTVHHLIQTDAAINPGNSGGPLLDSAGRLIGVNTAIYSPSGASAGIGFAVPVDTVNRVVPELIAHGKYLRPTLGVRSDERVTAFVSRKLGIKGVTVVEVVPGSSAEAVGLRGSRMTRDGLVPGDVIQTVDGKSVETGADIDRLLDTRNAGDKVVLGYWREGLNYQATLILSLPKR